MPNILIAFASNYGATQEIARYIGRVLQHMGLSVTVSEAEAISSIHSYKAVILGSALYFDNWLPAASEFLESFQDELTQKSVWLFSTGILVSATTPVIKEHFPKALWGLIETVHPRGLGIFGGKLEGHPLEEWLVSPPASLASHDHRDWLSIQHWAQSIAKALAPETPANPVRSSRYFNLEDACKMGNMLNIDWKKIDPIQFQQGMNVELEHGSTCPLTDISHNDPLITAKIVLAHLKEFPDYYARLAKMEQEAAAFWHVRS